MTIAERISAFRGAVEADQSFGESPPTVMMLTGNSNSAKLMDGGIFVGGPNFQRLESSADCIALVTFLRFPPDQELFLGVIVKTGLPVLKQWVAEMKRRGLAGDKHFSKSNNNAKVYLAFSDGQLYLRNKKFWSSLQEIDPGPPVRIENVEAGPGVTVDRVFYAIYPDNTAARSSQITGLLNTLRNATGTDRVEERHPWPDGERRPQVLSRMPVNVPIAEIKEAISKFGGEYADNLVERFHVGLNHLPRKHFVILTGLSGTGKTRLVEGYARAIHGFMDRGLTDSFLYMCPVRPDWTDPSGLTGYYDVIASTYVVPPFLEAVIVAHANPTIPVFVCLDEMNLARVEYYLSDALSAMESGQMIPLHSHVQAVRGSNGTMIEPAIELPPNLFLIGTVNIDETTHPISDKVLDRAVVIDTSIVNIAAFVNSLAQREPALASSVTACSPILLDIQKVLEPHKMGFGYRVAEEFIRYHDAALRLGTSTSEDALDQQVIQKILVKLKGTERQRDVLTKLGKLFAAGSKSRQMVDKLLEDLDSLGSFQATR